MLDGDFKAAWAIADAVLAGRDPRTRNDASRPYHERWVWDGTSLAGRAVVVRCYHGLGDTLQFVRFLPALRAQAAHVTLEVQAELYGLLAKAQGADRVVAFDLASPIPADVDIEIMELQHALREVPDGKPYLRVAPMPATGARVGVCWQAGGWDPDRSIPLEQLRPALPPHAASLQRGQAGVPDPLGGNMDIAATASFVTSLARVVAVDTMVAHLAGALGRPVDLLLKAEADWRWGRGAGTPWYGNTTIYRQHRPGDWSEVVRDLGRSLKPEG